MADLKNTSNRTPPTIHGIKTVSAGNRFELEQMDLTFSNGERRIYERLKQKGHGAVIVVPVNDQDEVLMIREYAAGTERYELGLVKGRIDPGEEPLDAANRELREEIGLAADKLTKLRQLSVMPGYMAHQTHVVLAQSLHSSPLVGDEPEPLDVVPVPLSDLEHVLFDETCSDGRCLASLLMAKHWLVAQVSGT